MSPQCFDGRPDAACPGRESAFTLVEMLVSVAVLILIMTFVSQMMTSTTVSTSMSGKHLDADSQARLVFDRMAVDFAGMPHRTDVDFIFSKQPDPLSASSTSGSSDKMFFYSEAPAYYDSSLFSGTTNSGLKSTVALVGYSCINTTGTSAVLPAYSLLRFSKGLTWDSSLAATGSSTPPGGMVFLTSTAVGALPIPASTLAGNPNWSGDIGSPPYYVATNQPDYQEFTDVLSNEVVRFEFCFEVKDLTNPNSPGSGYSNYPIARIGTANSAGNKSTPASISPASPNVGDRWYDTVNNRAYLCTGYNGVTPIWTPNGMADVRAIVVAIAILDPNSRKLLTPAELGSISAALLDPTEDTNSTTGLLAQPPHLMAEVWQNAISGASPTFASAAAIPIEAAAQIRIYQRFFYLNNL
jgi:hypothetical protein